MEAEDFIITIEDNGSEVVEIRAHRKDTLRPREVRGLPLTHKIDAFIGWTELATSGPWLFNGEEYQDWDSLVIDVALEIKRRAKDLQPGDDASQYS